MTATRELFPGYYPPTDEEVSRILQTEGIYSFDASSLLNILRFPRVVADKYLQILAGLGARVWIAYQAAAEYHRNMEQVIADQEEAYADVEATLTSGLFQLTERLRGGHRSHISIDIENIAKLLDSAQTSATLELERARAAQPQKSEFAELQNRLADILNGKIGTPFTPTEIQQLVKEGRVRYDLKIPPGYLDTKEKQEPERYGDLIIWREIVRYAQQKNRPIIFVTDDGKDDWWTRSASGERVGPRPELQAEIGRAANVRLLLYETPRFMTRALEVLGIPSEAEIVQQAQAVVSASQGEESNPRSRYDAFERDVLPRLDDLPWFASVDRQVRVNAGGIQLLLDAVAHGATHDYVIEIKLRSHFLSTSDLMELRGRVSQYEEFISRPTRSVAARGLLIGNLPMTKVRSQFPPGIAYVQFDVAAGRFVYSPRAREWLDVDAPSWESETGIEPLDSPP